MSSSTALYSSSDGITWTKRHTPSNVSHIMGISFTNDIFFVYSDNLSHSHTNPQSGTYFYGGGSTQVGKLTKSSDGISWSEISWSFEPISKITYLNARFVSVSGTANRCTWYVASSTNGDTWIMGSSSGSSTVPEYFLTATRLF